MRQFKFRVWCDAIEPGEMVYSKFIKFNKDGSIENDKYLGGKAMQFIGLFDSNNKEIYEGDIVRFKNDFNGEIVWSKEDCAFLMRRKNGGAAFLNQKYMFNFEVVGNIYENPELVLN